MGDPVISYSINSGVLPVGVMLNTFSGKLSGPPNSFNAGSSIVVRATNASGYEDISLTFVINDIAPASIAYANASYTWVKGTAITSQTPVGNTVGAVVTYVIQSGSLPGGITLDPSTGVLTGTPSFISTSSPLTIRATNSGGDYDISLTTAVNGVVFNKSGAEFYGATTADMTANFSVTNDGNLASSSVTTSFSSANPSYWQLVLDNCNSVSLNAAESCGMQIVFLGASGNGNSPASGTYNAMLTVTAGPETVMFNFQASIP